VCVHHIHRRMHAYESLHALNEDVYVIDQILKLVFDSLQCSILCGLLVFF
jgi:hypothetical protein